MARTDGLRQQHKKIRPPSARPALYERFRVGSRACLLLALLFSALPAAAGICPASVAPLNPEAGDLGPAPAGSYTSLCLSVVNDLPRPRSEIAVSGIALPQPLQLTDTRRLAVVAGNRLVSAQFSILSRWGGPLADQNLPARWVNVALPVQVAAQSEASFELRIYDSPPPQPDPAAITLNQDAGLWIIDTGLARFSVDPTEPALLSEVLLRHPEGDEVLIYQTGPTAGPRVVFRTATDEQIALGAQLLTDNSDADVLLRDSFEAVVPVTPVTAPSSVAPATPDSGSFRIVESGPVRVVLAASGHFVDPGGASLCAPGNTAPYESLGYTAALTFHRGSADVELDYEFRNECSDAQTGPWTDQTLAVDEVRWQFPLNGMPLQTAAVGYTSGHPSGQPLDLGQGPVSVRQLRGDFGVGGWQRQAQLTRGTSLIQSAPFFDQPLAAQVRSRWLAGLTAAWLRFREPQGLTATSAGLSFSPVSEPLTIGEGKGIWNHAVLALSPRVDPSSSPIQGLSDLVQSRVDRLERGLLPRAALADFNRARVLPSLGNDQPSTIKSDYLAWMNLLHEETVRPDGQFQRNGTFGSQLWPDTGSADPFNVDAQAPNANSSGMNYWDPAGNELLEYLRSGEPRWAWDFSLAAYRTQLHAAYLNTGANTHGNRAGVAVTSGGPGCEQFQPPCSADGSGGGQWHRSAFGSDDYTYAMSAELGYVLRPTTGLLERFAQAGGTVVQRYDPAVPEANREAFVNAVNFTRQVIQHFEMLANCAEFVPGQAGIDCNTRLHEVVGELARDNLAAGILCQGPTDFGAGLNGDIPGPPAALPTRCATPQQFMQNALMLPFLHRYYTNYGDPAEGSVGLALARSAQVLYQQGLPQQPSGALQAQGNWAARLDCQLSGDGRTVMSCQPAPDSDLMTAMSPHTRPHTAAMLLLGHEIDPLINLCDAAADVLNVSGFAGQPDNNAGGWNGVGHFNQAGWWKGSAQMLQSMVFGVGIADTCR